MRNSSYQKVNRDVLFEWIYDDANLITEPYKILRNKRDITSSYIGGNLTNNSLSNQLFPIDLVSNKWSKIDTNQYGFLTIEDYPSSGPVKHDTLRIYFPINYNFAEYSGIKIKIYTLDFTNKVLVDISNFYFDKFDTNQSSIRETILQPVLYEGRLWNQYIDIDIPSVSFLSSQRNSSGGVLLGSINDYLTNGSGLSITSPIFIDFSFITGFQQVGTQKNFFLSTPFTLEIPQSPELEELQLVIEESKEGDYFEIYPTFNGTFEEFVQFIETSYTVDKDYYTEYQITVFEENIKGKTNRFVIDSDFSEKVEFRPIFKYSTTIASIDVELKLIDRVSETVLTRRAIYGLKPNQLSKYLVHLKRIKVKNIQKPKIYVKNETILSQIDSLNRGNQQEVKINVDVPTLIDVKNVHAYSENDLNPKSSSNLDNYHPNGRMKIIIQPFDNIIKFSLARKVDNKLEFLDLTNCQNLLLIFNSEKSTYSFQIFGENINLSTGSISFKIPQSFYQSLKNIYLEKNNLFYITTTNNNIRTLIYSGLFIPSDSSEAQSITTPQNLQSLPVFFENPDLLQDALVVRKVLIGTSSFGIVNNGVQ
jgi:hypothetical protein